MRQLLRVCCLSLLLSGVGVPLDGLSQGAIAQTPPRQEQTGDPIQQVVAAGWMSRFPDGSFRAENLVSRAELAATLVKAFQLDRRATATREGAVPADDVPPSHWAYRDIQTVLKTGIMRGYRGNLFFPNQRVSRAEGFAIFAQAYGVFQFPDATVNELLTPYPDAREVPSWAQRAMATVLNEGFVNLGPGGLINPSQPLTRGDLAYALSQYLQQQQAPTVGGGR